MSTRHSLTRRNFLKTSVLTAAASALAPRSWSQVAGANDAVRLAVIGLNGRGGSHLNEFGKMKGVRIAALCDVDLTVLNRRTKGLENVQKYQDVRKLLESKEIDAVSIATTNHWHSLMTIWACQAGKDVYVEKPCSHNVFEGRKCVEAARKYKRIVQHGTQSRSGNFGRLAAIVRSGCYGKLLVSKGYCCKPRWSIGFKSVEPVPATLDFDLWLGPAAQRPFHRNLVHYNWHWFWDFGNGDIGNQGVHEMDKARWAIGAALPRSVVSPGGRYVNEPGFKDQGETPRSWFCVAEIRIGLSSRCAIQGPCFAPKRRFLSRFFARKERAIPASRSIPLRLAWSPPVGRFSLQPKNGRENRSQSLPDGGDFEYLP